MAQSSGLQASTSLSVQNEYGDYSIVVTGSYYCGCARATAAFGGSQMVKVERPRYVHNYLDKYVGGNPGCPTGAPRYWKVRDYQVQDANHNALQRVMPVAEFLTTTLNTCQINASVQGGALTTPSGTFRDNLYLCGPVPPCDQGQSCALVKTQNFTVEGVFVTPSFTLAYGCNSVTVQ